MKNKNLILSAGAVVVLGILISAVISKDKYPPPREPTDNEKSMLLTVDVLQDFGYTNMPREKCEEWTAQDNAYGITEVEYEYDADKAPDSEYIYFNSIATFEPSVEDAEQAFDLAISAIQKDAVIPETGRTEETPDLFDLGDQSFSARILIENDVFGNIVLVRKGRVIHRLVVTGLYFDQKEDLEDIFFKALANSNPDNFGTL